MATSVGFHETESALKPETKDRHRAIVSLMEELDAVDWYDQRVDTAGDDDLRTILAHNRDEEREHAMMLLEWLRRNAPGWEEQMRTYLYAEGPITEIEEAATGAAGTNGDGAPGDGSLGIGSLREVTKK
jgi:ferritin-like protein